MFDLSSDGFNYGMVILSEAKNLGMSINESLRFTQGDRGLDNNNLPVGQGAGWR